MLTTATIENLTPEDFNLLDAEDVVRSVTLMRIEELIDDGEFTYESKHAQRLREALQQLINTHQHTLNEQPKILAHYNKLLLRVGWESFLSLDEHDQVAFIEHHTVASLRHGFAVDQVIKKALDTREFATYADRSYRQKFVAGLRNNNETLGSATAAHWFAQYQGTLKEELDTPDMQERYLRSHPDVRELSDEDKGILKELLALDFSLNYPEHSDDFVSIAEAEEQIAANQKAFQPAGVASSPSHTTPAQETVPNMQEQRRTPATTTPEPQQATQEPEQTKSEESERSRVVSELIDTYHLHIDEGAALRQEVDRVFAGTTQLDEFAKHIQTAFSTQSPDEIQRLLSDVDRLIFKPAQKHLMDSTTKQASGDPVSSGADAVRTKLEGAVRDTNETIVLPETKQSEPYASDPYREPIE